MPTVVPISSPNATELKAKWQTLRRNDPQLRIHEAAEHLGVSEAELLATGCGENVTRLKGDSGQLIHSLPRLGRVLAVTGNRHAVLEKRGHYGNVSITGNRGLVLTDQIDLRLILKHWCLGFAVQEEVEGKPRLSLQFFDREGGAAHQVFLTEESRHHAYEAAVECYCAKDQSPGQVVGSLPAAAQEKSDGTIDRAGLMNAGRGMQDIDDFFHVLETFEAGHTQALRLADRALAYPVAASSLALVLERACATKTPIRVLVGNRGAIQVHSGPVRCLRRTGPWLVALDENFSLHVREQCIASAWVVRQPPMDGAVTSLELYDEADEPIVSLSGQRQPGDVEPESWRRFLAELPALDVPALMRSARRQRR